MTNYTFAETKGAKSAPLVFTSTEQADLNNSFTASPVS